MHKAVGCLALALFLGVRTLPHARTIVPGAVAVANPCASDSATSRPPSNGGGDDVDLAELDALIKASVAKFKGPALADLVTQVQARVREQVPAFGAESGWTAATRAIATRLKTPVPTTPIEFGPIRMVSEKTGHPKVDGPNELFQSRTVTYRFGMRDFFLVADEPKVKRPIEAKDVPPAHQLTWILTGHVPEVELAVAAIQCELDVDRSRDKLSRFLEYWRNGREPFYQALDRTAGTKEAIFFYDAMLGEFVAKLAPDLQKARTLSEKHDRLHDAFLTVRQYRRFIEAASLALVSTDAFPARLKDFEYSSVAGSAQVRDAIELVLAAHKWDIAKAIDDIKAVLSANPMPAVLWGKYDPQANFIKWFLENSADIKARIQSHDPGSAGMVDAPLAVRCREKRREIELKVRAAARACLQEQGISGK